MKSFKSLLQVLNKEAKLQEKLLAMLAEERTQIVHLQREALEDLSERKETVLLDLQSLSNERSFLFKNIKAEFNLDFKSPKLSEILEFCEDQALKSSLSQRGESLKELVVNVNLLNKENGVLLKQSLGLISSTISIMTARPQANNTSYGRNAKVSSEDESEMTIISSFNRSV